MPPARPSAFSFQRGGLPAAYWYLWTATLVSRLGGFLFTFLAVYLTQTRGFSVASAGAVVALHGVGSLLAGPIGGWLSDNIGRRKTLLMACALGALSMLQLGAARQPWHIGLATLLLGLLSDLGRPATQAAVADMVAPEERQRAFSLMFWAVNLGYAGAAVLAGQLANVSYWLLFGGDAAATALCGIIVFLAVPETRPVLPPRGPAMAPAPRADPLLPYRDGVLLMVILSQFLVGFVYCQAKVTLPLDLVGRGVSMPEFGRLIAINGVLIVLLQPLAGRVVIRYPRGRVLAAGTLLVGIGFGMTALRGGTWLYAASITVWTLGEIIFSPVASTVVADLAPPMARGAYQGAYQMTWGAASLSATAIGAALMQRLGSEALWGLCLLLSIASATMHLTTAAARRRRFQSMPDGKAALAREHGWESP